MDEPTDTFLSPMPTVRGTTPQSSQPWAARWLKIERVDD
jgi:hypothetical protein